MIRVCLLLELLRREVELLGEDYDDGKNEIGEGGW